jgi:hypothetical protein
LDIRNKGQPRQRRAGINRFEEARRILAKNLGIGKDKNDETEDGYESGVKANALCYNFREIQIKLAI